MTDLSRRQARDTAIRAVLPLVPDHGWTMAALRRSSGADADRFFPGGSVELVEAYIDMADRDMAAAAVVAGQRHAQRVRTLIDVRLDQAFPHRRAVRRAATVLAYPTNAPVAARCTARTVSAIWEAAGDASTGFGWYSKRAILTCVYTSTLLFWLDDAHDHTETLAFLDRRLAGVAQIGQLRKTVSGWFRPQ